MICHTTCVGVVLLNHQSRIVIEKPIEDVRRLARGHRDHLGIERPKLVGDVGIEGSISVRLTRLFVLSVEAVLVIIR